MPKPPLAPRIDHYTITKDGEPTRLASDLPHEPYGVLGEVLVECGPHDEPVNIPLPEGFSKRCAALRSAQRRARRIRNRTSALIHQLSQSIHYDSQLARRLGPAGRFAIIPIYETRTCRECGCSSDTKSAKRGRRGQKPPYWVATDLCSACDRQP